MSKLLKLGKLLRKDNIIKIDEIVYNENDADKDTYDDNTSNDIISNETNTNIENDREKGNGFYGAILMDCFPNFLENRDHAIIVDFFRQKLSSRLNFEVIGILKPMTSDELKFEYPTNSALQKEVETLTIFEPLDRPLEPVFILEWFRTTITEFVPSRLEIILVGHLLRTYGKQLISDIILTFDIPIYIPASNLNIIILGEEQTFETPFLPINDQYPLILIVNHLYQEFSAVFYTDDMNFVYSIWEPGLNHTKTLLEIYNKAVAAGEDDNDDEQQPLHMEDLTEDQLIDQSNDVANDDITEYQYDPKIKRILDAFKGWDVQELDLLLTDIDDIETLNPELSKETLNDVLADRKLLQNSANQIMKKDLKSFNGKIPLDTILQFVKLSRNGSYSE